MSADELVQPLGGGGGRNGGDGGGDGDGGGGDGEGGGGEGAGAGAGAVAGAGGGAVVGSGGARTSAKVVATMRLRIERVQGGVALACRNATALIVVVAVAVPDDRMLEELSEVGLTQREHLSVTVSKL